MLVRRAKTKRPDGNDTTIGVQKEETKRGPTKAVKCPSLNESGRLVKLFARRVPPVLRSLLIFLPILALLAVALGGSLIARGNNDSSSNKIGSINSNSKILIRNSGRGDSNSLAVATRRRSKAHICFSKVHGELGTHYLLNKFGYVGIDATKDKDWDLIYGGYPHCGDRGIKVKGREIPTDIKDVQPKRWDWRMKSGLNRVLNKRGWDNLKPHQVYFPCMGCSAAYCNKRELCRILAGIDPELCYVLPDDSQRLKAAMAADKRRQWVVKMDASDMHVHTGRGVWYIQTPKQLPSKSEQERGIYLVQPFTEPFLGKGLWRRKSEMRFYVALTSVYPLRAYVHNAPYVIVAAKEYTNSSEAVADECMHDTHSSTKACEHHVAPDSAFAEAARDSMMNEAYKHSSRFLYFDKYAEKAGMSNAQRDELVDRTHQLISEVLKAGHHEMEEHPINRGIQKSGASCFSHMRVDVGITADVKPFIFEFPEFHGLFRVSDDSSPMDIAQLDKDRFIASIGELFHMVGLDGPPVPAERRAEFESARLGGWRLLPNLG